MTNTLMHLHDIRAMFSPGTFWESENDRFPERNGLRKVRQVTTKEIVWELCDGSDMGKAYYTPLPKAREITHANPEGVLAWTFCATNGKPVRVKFTKLR